MSSSHWHHCCCYCEHHFGCHHYHHYLFQDWKSGRTLLHVAAETNNTDLAEFLLSHPSISVDAVTYEGHTALRLAVGRQHTNVIQLLMLNGATPGDSEQEENECEQEDMECSASSDSDVDDGFDDLEFQGQAVFKR